MTAAFPVEAQAVIPIRVANPTADDDPIGVASAHFAKRVSELAGNAVAVRVFSRGALGNENTALEGTIAGNIDVDIVSNTVLSGVVPELGVLDVPYGLTSPDHAWKVLDGDIGKSLNERIQAKGVRVAGWAYAGSRCLMTKNKSVKTVADLAQMKLRVPNNQTYSDIAKAWGTIATTVPWPETYLALSQGVVDGIETAPGPSFDQKHFEVAKYLIRTDHLIYFHLWVISEKSWQSWPEPVRAAVATAAKRSCADEPEAAARPGTRCLRRIREARRHHRGAESRGVRREVALRAGQRQTGTATTSAAHTRRLVISMPGPQGRAPCRESRTPRGATIGTRRA